MIVLKRFRDCRWGGLRVCVRWYGSVSCAKSDKKAKPTTRWFYATGLPLAKSQRELQKGGIGPDKKEKWIPFSQYDSAKLERTYQRYVNPQFSEMFLQHNERSHEKFLRLIDHREVPLKAFYQELERAKSRGYPIRPLDHVLVNEDNLFAANIKDLTISSVYWDGPVYAIRRGLWFDENNNPVDMGLSQAVEQGFQRLRPWMFQRGLESSKKETMSKKGRSNEMRQKVHDYWTVELPDKSDKQKMVRKHIFYVDSTNAYIVDDLSTLNRLKLFLLQNLPKGATIVPGLTYVKRGYDENGKTEKKASSNDDVSKDNFSKVNKDTMSSDGEVSHKAVEDSSITGMLSDELEKILSFDFSESKAAEVFDHQLDTDITKDTESETSNQRDVDHLVFCVHGIGQILGAKYENINFIHTVNFLRKNLKKNSREILGTETNCKIQVIPIIWRNLIDFNNSESIGKDGLKTELPTLKNITIKEIEPVRYLINNTLLDILLYYEAPYKNEILYRVTQEINRAFRKFLIYNPSFKGKVSLVGHSLGSAIGYDILSLQKFNLRYRANEINNTNQDIVEENDEEINNILNKKLESSSTFFETYSLEDCQLDFNVDNYFAIGSPFGIFSLLKQKRLESRKLLAFYPNRKLVEEIDFAAKSFPSCNRFYNIFDSCDPVAYRVEPLINKEFADTKVAEIKYEKLLGQNPKLLNSIGDEIINTSKTYFSEYTGTGLSLINKQFESILGKSVFSDSDKHDKELPVERSRLLKTNGSKDEKRKVKHDADKSKIKVENNTETVEVSQKLHDEPFNHSAGSTSNKSLLEKQEDYDVNGDEVTNELPAHVAYNNTFYNFEGNDAQIRKQVDILSCNNTGHVDHCIPQNVYDVLLINTLTSHTTYFENEHISKFLLNELLYTGENPSDGLIDDPNKRIVERQSEKQDSHK